MIILDANVVSELLRPKPSVAEIRYSIGALIASIAGATGFSIATRDTAPFEAAGVVVVNPFDETE